MELSLPNLHPALVHFPIALVPIALLFDFFGAMLRKTAWLDRAATTLWILAGVTAFFAVEAGESAVDGLANVSATVEPLIGEHSDWGHWVLYGLVLFALLRLGATLWDPDRRRVAARWALLLPELALLALVAYTADLGGNLVYGHGIAVNKTSEDGLRAMSGLGESADGEATPEDGGEHGAGDETGGSADAAPGAGGDPSSRLQTGDDGTAVWRPASGDSAALGQVVTALGDTSLDAVEAAPGDGEGGGLKLQVSGDAWLALPGSFGDVRVEVELETLDFEGEIGLFHHAQGPDAAGLLVQATSGEQTLWELRDERRELHAVDHSVPEGVFVLAVSSAGKHLKGLVDGATITHGHIEPGPEGRVGLLLRGEGSVRLVRLSAQPL